MDGSDPRRQTDPLGLGMTDREDSHEPRTAASDSIQSCLNSLRDLMQSLPPSASEVS